MAAPLDYALVAAYLLVLGGVAVQYRRGAIPRDRLLVLVGACITWLAYGLLRLTRAGPFPAGSAANTALNALAVVILVAGLYALSRWWRGRDAA